MGKSSTKDLDFPLEANLLGKLSIDKDRYYHRRLKTARAKSSACCGLQAIRNLFFYVPFWRMNGMNKTTNIHIGLWMIYFTDKLVVPNENTQFPA